MRWNQKVLNSIHFSKGVCRQQSRLCLNFHKYSKNLVFESQPESFNKKPNFGKYVDDGNNMNNVIKISKQIEI